MSNGPTEAVNNLIKRIKWIAFGFRKFGSYRIRALLYAGKPNWDLLATEICDRVVCASRGGASTHHLRMCHTAFDLASHVRMPDGPAVRLRRSGL